MDELLKNYIKHIDNNISPNLAKELSQTLTQQLEKNQQIEDIEIILKETFVKYIRRMNSKDSDITAKRLYDSYVDYDDNNLIRSNRFLIRIYQKFFNLKLSKYFC